MIEITLPFPASALMPNRARRNHWAQKAGYAQAARMTARVETLNTAEHGELPTFSRHERIPLRLEFYPPNLRPRDLDNLLAAMKPSLDGVCDALEVNDKMFCPIVLDWGKVERGGKVVVKIGD